ncbi:MAG: Glycosyltransferase [Parcubacteria bacterium C7867-004]|nr:MAG: Glycosyltransferase [Parcubacteria bacterium C7867-004]
MGSYTEVAARDRRLRILYVITKANWGGAQRYVFDMAIGANEAGHEVLVVSGAGGELTKRLKEAGIPVAFIGTMTRDIHIGSEIDAFRELFRIVRQFRPDIIHGNSSKAGGLAAIAGRLAGIERVMFTAHGWAFNEDRPAIQKAVIAAFHYLTVLLCHRTICVSEALARDTEWMPFASSRIRVVQNGIDEEPLLPREEARTRLAPGFEKALWIGTIAELHPTKQLHVLINAFARLQERQNEVGLVIMGEGDERELLTTQIEERGLTSSVVLCGHVPNASVHLSALDIFALPSRSEGLGYVLLEAGLAKLPAVASNVGGIPEIIRDKESGILVPSGDSTALTDALELLVSNERLRTELGHALYERVIRVFPKAKMVRETLALYRER